MPPTNNSGVKLSIVISVALALIFVVFGGIAHGYSWRNVSLLASAGAIIGFIGAPYIEPKAFKYPTLWQIFFSVLGCMLLATFLNAEADGYVLALLIGIVIGYLAPYWVKHIQIL